MTRILMVLIRTEVYIFSHILFSPSIILVIINSYSLHTIFFNGNYLFKTIYLLIIQITYDKLVKQSVS